MKALDEIIGARHPELAARIGELREKSGATTEDVLIRTDVLPDSSRLDILSEFYEIPKIESIPEEDIDQELIKRFPISFAKKFRILPISRSDGRLRVALAPPPDLCALDEIKSRFGCSLDPRLALEHVLGESINRVYEQGRDERRRT